MIKNDYNQFLQKSFPLSEVYNKSEENNHLQVSHLLEYVKNTIYHINHRIIVFRYAYSSNKNRFHNISSKENSYFSAANIF